MSKSRPSDQPWHCHWCKTSNPEQAIRPGWCATHWQEWEARWHPGSRKRARERPPCSYPGCARIHYGGGWCGPHYIQAQRGRTIRPIRTERSHRTISAQGYVLVYNPDHPNAYTRGWMPEHVKIMSERLGRPLLHGENVHHINGVKGDNRTENLELWVTSQPKGQRAQDLVRWAREILDRYT